MYMKYDRTIKNIVQQATSQSTDAYYGFNVFHMRVNSNYSVLMRISKALLCWLCSGALNDHVTLCRVLPHLAVLCVIQELQSTES